MKKKITVAAAMLLALSLSAQPAFSAPAGKGHKAGVTCSVKGSGADYMKKAEKGKQNKKKGIKNNKKEAKYQIEVAFQYLLEEAYGEKVNDCRIRSIKVYSAKAEKKDEALRSLNLGPDEVAFEISYELHPAEGVNVNELMAATGSFDKESGWVVEKYNVGVLRPNKKGSEPPYVITDFGTGF